MSGRRQAWTSIIGILTGAELGTFDDAEQLTDAVEQADGVGGR